MKRSSSFLIKSFRIVILFVTLSPFSTSVFANCYGKTTSIGFPNISVINNGVQYTEISKAVYKWTGGFNIECGFFGRVESWEFYPNLNVEGLGTLYFNTYPAKKSYNTGIKPKSVSKNVEVIFPDVYIQDYAVAACNLHADLLRQGGASDSAIFGQEHKIALELRAYAYADVTIGDYVTEVSFTTFREIVCKKWSDSQVSDTDAVGVQIDFKLQSAGLVLFPINYEGECPKKMNLFMKVEGNKKGKFEARVESSAGWKSEKVVLQMEKFENSSGNWVREIDETLDVPVMLPTPPTPSGGGSHGSFGDMIPLPHDPGEDIPDGPDWTPTGVIFEDTPGNNIHKASLRLVAKAGEQTVSSKWREYNYTCKPKVGIEVPSEDLFFPDNPPANGSSNSAISKKALLQSQSKTTEKKQVNEEKSTLPSGSKE